MALPYPAPAKGARLIALTAFGLRLFAPYALRGRPTRADAASNAPAQTSSIRMATGAPTSTPVLANNPMA